uniref:Uncharacterized protein n=1 Tax=viral metagenome TaxID=1070528 RepID=A0A6C0F088_9ZZZZ
MPTPDASQYTRFRRYRAITSDLLSTGGVQPLGGLSTYVGLPIASSSEALFLSSLTKKTKPLTDTQGLITLNNPITTPVMQNGGYNLFTFTPTQSGWYRIILDGFIGGDGGNDIDLAVGNGNAQIDIPAIVDYDLNENYNSPPETPIKVFSFSGSNNDRITSYFTAGQTYQVLAIGYNINTAGTYTLTVRDNRLTQGVDNGITSTFYYSGSYQLYRFIPTQNYSYGVTLDFNDAPGPGGANRADLFISEANTTLDIQECIEYLTEEGSLPESVRENAYGEGSKTVYTTLTAGSTYEVLVYQYNTSSLFDPYELTVFYD